MMSVLRSPRWLGLTLLTVLLSATFVRLGMWQLDRHDQRHAANAAVRENAAAKPAPVQAVLAADREVAEDVTWRQVSARGRYDTSEQLLVRNRSLEGNPGYHVLTPLVTADGTALLVDRGWVPAGRSAAGPAEVPAPPEGEVSVVGRVRASEPAAKGGRPPEGQVTRIDIPAIAGSLTYPVYGGYVELTEEEPSREPAPTPIPPPELSDGPHLAYAVQWFLFVGIAAVGWVILTREEVRGPRTALGPTVRGRTVVEEGRRPS